MRNLNYCYVEFYHWYEIGENDYGRFVIYTPADQKSWYFEQDYEGTKPFWSRDTYNLQWFIDKGYPEIQVGFHFVSQDQPPDLSGWYIDDVRVYDTVDLNTCGPRAGRAGARAGNCCRDASLATATTAET